MKLGRALKNLRRIKGLTKKQMAVEIGITKLSWAMYERNKRVPRDEVKVKMAMYFKNMAEELFEEGLEACNHEDEGEGVGGHHKFCKFPLGSKTARGV